MAEKGEKRTQADVHLSTLLTSIKRRRFVVAFVENGGNATAAAEKAGFAVPNVESARLLKDGSVLKAIEYYSGITLQVAGESRDTIMQRTINRARSKMSDYFVTPATATADEWKLKPPHLWTEDQARCVKTVSWTRYGPRLELYDSSASDRHLAEYAGMTQKDDAGLTPEGAASLIAAAMNEMDALDDPEANT